MGIIELSEDEQNEELELLVQEGLEAHIRNLLSPLTHIMSLHKTTITPKEQDIDQANKSIAKIIFVSSFYNN